MDNAIKDIINKYYTVNNIPKQLIKDIINTCKDNIKCKKRQPNKYSFFIRHLSNIKKNKTSIIKTQQLNKIIIKTQEPTQQKIIQLTQNLSPYQKSILINNNNTSIQQLLKEIQKSNIANINNTFNLMQAAAIIWNIIDQNSKNKIYQIINN